ncbi:hypothetical protein [uncultured Aquimarina sp.]|uniref:hypothetical protein n=1 Tax=uncultured Aquimarina sp. TaxID=575652 RepID=UPI00262B4B3D|nr:hypothetical protein [uncultured Aquimarina sp.]
MHSFGLPQSPDYVTYIIYGLLLIFTFLILKKIKKAKDQKKGCGVFLFYVIGGIPFCYLLLKLAFGSILALYGIVFYPEYEAKVVDSVSKYNGRSDTGRKIYLNYAVLELKNKEGDTIRIDSNEGTNEEIVKGLSTRVSYRDGIIIKNSFWSIPIYIGSILVSIAMICGLLFFFYIKI